MNSNNKQQIGVRTFNAIRYMPLPVKVKDGYEICPKKSFGTRVAAEKWICKIMAMNEICSNMTNEESYFKEKSNDRAIKMMYSANRIASENGFRRPYNPKVKCRCGNEYFILECVSIEEKDDEGGRHLWHDVKPEYRKSKDCMCEEIEYY